MTVINWTEEEKMDIINSYNNHISLIKLGKKYNVAKSTIKTLLLKNNIDIRYTDGYRKYPIKEDFFDNIDSQEKAYFIGLLYADGNNSKGVISLVLQERDKEMLIQLNNMIQPTKPLSYRDQFTKHNKNHQNQYQLSIHNQHMQQRLNELGVVKAKSLVITFPQWLDKDLTRHFIRGYYDGNGSIGINKDFSIQIVSTLSFCESIKKITSDILSIESHVYIDKALNQVIRRFKIFRKKDMLKFLDWIYEGSSIYLPRKYEKYLLFKEHLKYYRKKL